ncbi:L-gulonolactone/D-arabinono-1,4-lactone oxidase [Saccharata proteae CBS 121410]|uniref:D-arabinono-1,4-lactone oxidase n=1 Tax=Saccharata proteae CBS 121410 TaxID=1314787 RepID=A0A9P4HT42_9PEZI|nr:L-gulonolactone/D-arabinono-1,4-lactone oxidase [Saccharata proteae CBS 121410]
MPPLKLDDELDKLDPAIAFRATKAHVHHTWARTFHSYPELYIRPQTLEEVQKLVTLARRCRRRLVVVGCGHSPSDLTCTSSWMVNLDQYNKVLRVDRERNTMTVQAGIRLYQFNQAAKEFGLTMPNLGSIDQQSIVGAMATATHGSSTRHGLLSSSVKSLKIVLSNGNAVLCSAEQNEDLFRAALVSLGALGIIVEVEYEMVPATNIEWEQRLTSLQYVLDTWNKDLWTQKEFTRVWWLPYMKRAILWQADVTSKPPHPAVSSWYGGSVGFHTYHILLWLAHYFPRILPGIEWFVFGMQYGFKENSGSTAVEEMRTGLLMNCLYSQFVNEWALPLRKGPEAITRLSAWLNGDTATARIPFDPTGLWVHAPIEVRVSDNSTCQPRPFLDNTADDGPTLYLNATLYRPYNKDPPCRDRYYEAFEWLMKELGGKPHWAKNFATITHADLASMYGENLSSYLRVRNEADPDGMFLGDWHRRTILPPSAESPLLPLEEREIGRRQNKVGGVDWFGEQAVRTGPKSASSEESFEVLHGAEAEASMVLPHLMERVEGVDGWDEKMGEEVHGSAVKGVMGTQVFNKM